MFIFASLLAASIDACLRGFLLGKIEIKYRFVDYFKIFVIIFLVCALACFLGDEINQIYSRRYLNIIGGFLMLFLSASAFNGARKSKLPKGSLPVMALSLARDGAAVCMYLAFSGYDILFVSFFSALFHILMLWAGVAASKFFAFKREGAIGKYFSALVFFLIAVYKFCQI